MRPEAVRAWQRIIRDFVIVIVGTFMLVHETITRDAPNPYLIAAGLAALGLPPALRFDYERRKTNGKAEGEDAT